MTTSLSFNYPNTIRFMENACCVIRLCNCCKVTHFAGHKDARKSEDTAPLILNLDTIWR